MYVGLLCRSQETRPTALGDICHASGELLPVLLFEEVGMADPQTRADQLAARTACLEPVKRPIRKG